MIAVGPDVMLSGGLRYFIPKSAKVDGTAAIVGDHLPLTSKRGDEKNLLKIPPQTTSHCCSKN